jgi:putative hydrolase of the HAD superfamily
LSKVPAVRIRNVVFDFGGVLVNWNPAEVVAGLFSGNDLRRKVMQSIFRHPDWLEIDRGALSEAQAIERFSDRTGLGADILQELMDRIRESLTLIPETASLIHDLSERGMRVYGLSNMSAATFRMLAARYDIWSVFDGVLISGDVGLVKPDAAIFERLVADHALEPPESMFVDDLLPNVEAARRLGFAAMHFRGSAECRAELARHMR